MADKAKRKPKRDWDGEYEAHLDTELAEACSKPCAECGDPVGTPGATYCPDCEGYRHTANPGA